MKRDKRLPFCLQIGAFNQRERPGERGEPAMSQAIDQYISDQREDIQPILHQVRETLRSALPEAEERISWRMPTYWKNHNIIYFAAFKNHMGIYTNELNEFIKV